MLITCLCPSDNTEKAVLLNTVSQILRNCDE